MKNAIRWMMGAAVALAATTAMAEDNALTDAEKSDGWKLLFDGKSLDQWQGLNRDELGKGWQVVDGTLTLASRAGAGDIITREQYSSFEFDFEFRLTKGANSGVKYLVNMKLSSGSHGVGYEYQVLDDENHPDAKLGKNGSRTVASLYDIIPASKDKKVNPPGEWNSGRIIVKGKHVEHWLNGMKVLEYERGSDAYIAAIKGSKFGKNASFGTNDEGYILLQDHGNEVSFRNMKIRPL